jgi:hypothetical protein
MTAIQRSADCGNSPKNSLLEELTIALETADVPVINTLVTGQIVWNRIGQASIAGIDAIRDALDPTPKLDEISILHVVSHGRAGAVNGTTRSAAGEVAFCHMFEFTNTKGDKVRSIDSYSIVTPRRR